MLGSALRTAVVPLREWRNAIHSERGNVWLARATTVVLFVVVAFQLVRLTWLLVPQLPQQASPRAFQTDAARDSTRPQSSVLVDLADLHLFGVAPKDQPKAAPAPVMVDTPLSLSLRGTLASDDDHLARAIIADEKDHEQAYWIDQALPGGAVLKEIHPDHIVLARSEQLETLRLPKAGKRTGAGPRVRNVSDTSPGPPPTPVSPSTDFVLTDMQKASLNDPGILRRLFGQMPLEQDGVTKGYMMQPLHDAVLLKRLELRQGDIVTAVNGVPLTGPDGVSQFLELLPTAHELQIQFERNGKPRTKIISVAEQS